MENVLWQQILNYGALSVLTVIFFLFARGYIVSKETLNDAISSHKTTIEKIVADNEAQRIAYENSVKQISQTFQNTVENMCRTFSGMMSEAKEIVNAANTKKKGK